MIVLEWIGFGLLCAAFCYQLHLCRMLLKGKGKTPETQQPQSPLAQHQWVRSWLFNTTPGQHGTYVDSFRRDHEIHLPDLKRDARGGRP